MSSHKLDHNMRKQANWGQVSGSKNDLNAKAKLIKYDQTWLQCLTWSWGTSRSIHLWFRHKIPKMPFNDHRIRWPSKKTSLRQSIKIGALQQCIVMIATLQQSVLMIIVNLPTGETLDPRVSSYLRSLAKDTPHSSSGSSLDQENYLTFFSGVLTNRVDKYFRLFSRRWYVVIRVARHSCSCCSHPPRERGRLWFHAQYSLTLPSTHSFLVQ